MSACMPLATRPWEHNRLHRPLLGCAIGATAAQAFDVRCCTFLVVGTTRSSCASSVPSVGAGRCITARRRGSRHGVRCVYRVYRSVCAIQSAHRAGTADHDLAFLQPAHYQTQLPHANTACPAERPHTRIKGKVHVTTGHARSTGPFESRPRAYNLPAMCDSM